LAAGALVLAAAGCAFPNGSMGGDPLLGNFNRPIVPTPPPERGGLGPDTPAYDGGARIGVGAPDVGAAIQNTSGRMQLPAPAPNPISGARLPSSGPDEVLHADRRTPAGAQLPVPSGSAVRNASFESPEPQTMPEVAGGVTGPSLPPLRLASHVMRDTSRPQTTDEVRARLKAAGALAMRSEQAADGEWVFDCTLNGEAYQGRGPNALEAMRLVLEMLQKHKE
jgi:hypothetical protein